MNKETYTEWYEGLKARLAAGDINQVTYESLIVSNLHSLMTRHRHAQPRVYASHLPLSKHFELINHYFELIADAEMSERNARHLVCFVAGIIEAIPAARAFGKKHNTPLPPSKEYFEGKLAWGRKKVASSTEAIDGCPVITQVNEPGNEVTIELPWKLALHVYKGFLVKVLMSKHGYKYSDAYNHITEHQNKYDDLLAEVLNDIIANKESHLVSVGGGITAAGTGLVVSGIIKPEA